MFRYLVLEKILKSDIKPIYITSKLFPIETDPSILF